MKIIIRWRPLALFGLALLGLALRLYGINWDQGNNFHPDERQILFQTMNLSWPKSFAQFLDPATSPLNPHFFAYGSFPLYLLATLGNIIAHFYPGIDTIANLTLVGRALSAIFDTGTILLTGWLGLLLARDTTPGRPKAWNLALLSAALVTFTPFEIQQAHFFAVDSLLLFFIVLTLLACVALVDTEAPIRWSLVAGLGYGLAFATKFSAAPLAVPVVVALLLRWYKYDFSTSLLSLLVTTCTTIIVFLIAMPYALLDFANFKAQVSFQGDLARGLVDLPYVRQFAGTTPYVYEARNMILWGLGLTLGIAAFAGLAWFLWRVWKRNAGSWLVVLSWVLVYSAITGSFYVKYMRYMLPIYPFMVLMASALLLALVDAVKERGQEGKRKAPTRHPHRSLPLQATRALPYAAIALVLAGTIFQGLALLNIYSQPSTRIQASLWIYTHIKPGSVFTYEQWDDPLPVPIGNYSPFIYPQSTYKDASGQMQTGLDLYGDDTVQKARQLATLLPTINVITMATDRLDKSIPRLPFRYPLTIHYYQLLFSGQLGFHLAAKFENHPNLFGITLDDSSADESYSVFDHPTVKIFVRDNPYPYTPQQLYQKLMAGVQLPPPGADLSGAQRPLLLSPQQIANDQQSPPFSAQFPASSLSNASPTLFWWLAIMVLGLLVYPIVFSVFRGLSDRGYIFSKTLGILFLSYIAWMLASLHILPFNFLSLALILLAVFACSVTFFILQRKTILPFLREHWRLLLIEEELFSLAFLLFVGIRSLNPDLWNPFLGGEKPMELAFLNAVLRSPYMPPYDPWFSGGYINYYYYGYVIIGTLIKLTGIVPTTAFNLAIPALFALTFSGAVSLVYNLSRSVPIALLGGYFATMIGNLDGLGQLKGQLAAALAHKAIPAFNYWQSSRIIPFTINEFPFWSFLFADLHPHVIDMPIAILMLGILAALLLVEGNKFRSNGVIVELDRSRRGGSGDEAWWGRLRRPRHIALYVLAAFVFGTIACVNPWDIPVYALLLAAVLIVRTLYMKRQEPVLEKLIALGFCLVGIAIICGLGYLFYWPFYAFYQELYINGLGLVAQGTSLGDYLTVFGFWLFLVLSFLLVELYRRWRARNRLQFRPLPQAWRIGAYLLLCTVVLALLAALGLKILLFSLVLLGVFLFASRYVGKYIAVGAQFIAPNQPLAPNQSLAPRKVYPFTESVSNPGFNVSLFFTYLLLLMGLCITLGQEIVYVRDFLDGSAYYRMNTVFKFSIQAWLCFGIGGALAVWHIWRRLGGIARQARSVVLAALILACSIFLVEGTAARIGDHQLWVEVQPPVQSDSYTPTLNGFAFAYAWYPGDAQAIAWLNQHVSGSPVVLEAAAPASYQWYNRVSVYTGLPDVLGWPDHEEEQRYSSQLLNRSADIATIYMTPDPSVAMALLRFYNVHYIYVGLLEQQVYGQQSPLGLQKFDRMVVDKMLRIVYHAGGVTIYEVI